ncbi:FAD/NAD(P)-binding domain-containing protein [Rhizopus microsporus ATCC 52813]|uniref:FAD/NAD(P)-binding domain-containing protein n=1 Tax=Rhizopus microsporus ATCC 52813 TaxID=1340429 RepID=A0A2G4SVR2_RHIZD|nr:FAD/NAD(P)-binding domain-containing protein [Rhizopus microsporus ATCC 52813]PHZ12835.1 FAD/NAD(P)-binding domain-containing protein [Rhizopus microsporus ATCC 52813]
MSQHSLSSSSSSSINTESSSSSTILNDGASTCSNNYTLHQVLSNPKLLCAFECFLRQTWSHENLLFIEAMTQLKHEESPKAVEASLHRIYKNFLAKGSPLELNVTTQDKVRQDIQALQWAIVDRVDAVTILQETEAQVMDMLKQKLAEFIETMEVPIGNISPAMIKHDQVRVVVVGGGFTGFTVASILDQMPRFYVTLIDTKDSFEYTPGIVKKIVNPDQSSSLRVRHDAYVKNGRVIIGYAEELCDDGKSVKVNNELITFDYLVIATGSSYSSQLKSSDTSSLYRMSGLEESYLELLKARRVLIIGGGLVGCELASEISQQTFPGAYPKKHVTLIDSHSNVVNRSDPRQQNMARKYLEELGVEVVCNEKIIDFDSTGDNVYLGSSGRIYSGYDKVFFATGTRPNTALFASSTIDSSLDDCLDTWGRIRVKPTLQIDHWKYEHIFAGGDVTNVVEEKTGYAATISGVCIARNICRLVKGKTPLKQGTKGTLPAPEKPLHGMLEHGGIGKRKYY